MIVKCPKCGMLVSDRTAECPSCGEILNAAALAAQQASEQEVVEQEVTEKEVVEQEEVPVETPTETPAAPEEPAAPVVETMPEAAPEENQAPAPEPAPAPAPQTQTPPQPEPQPEPAAQPAQPAPAVTEAPKKKKSWKGLIWGSVAVLALAGILCLYTMAITRMGLDTIKIEVHFYTKPLDTVTETAPVAVPDTLQTAPLTE